MKLDGVQWLYVPDDNTRMLKLKSLFCEPHAFNIGPNRTLQKAGFKYLKTHMTVPGPYNFHQAVNRWVLEVD